MLRIASSIVQLLLGASGAFLIAAGQYDKAAATLSMAAYMGVVVLQIELLTRE